MRVSTRLVLLILGCLLPIAGAQVYTQLSLNEQRKDQLSVLALRQAELANSDIGSILRGVEQFATVAAQLPDVRAGGTACDERLDALRHQLPSFRFLAVANLHGVITCASEPGLKGQPERADWLSQSLPGDFTGVGVVTRAPGIDAKVLPVSVPLAGSAAGYIIAALDLDWLNVHLHESRSTRAAPLTNSGVVLLDRAGGIIGRYPETQFQIGQIAPEGLRNLMTRTAAGVSMITDGDGNQQLAASVPATIPPLGITTVEMLSLAHVTADLEAASVWDLSMITVAAVAALLLAWLAGRRFIYQPTEALLNAAQRWRDGDLSARAAAGDTGSEFEALAQSFNAMAEALEAREAELESQAHLLEIRVAERTRELSESNNRLQVEISEREKTEAQLHQAQKLQAIGQLAGGIAHDFNNMLATILGNLELMERRVPRDGKPWTDADSQKLTALIERATGAVQRGSQLTSQLLAFSRRQRLAVRPTDLNHLITELITLATSTLGRRIRVMPSLDPGAWPAMVDPSQVEAALLNLCLNARDAMPEGGQLTIATGREVIAERSGQDDLKPGEYVRVVISDTGVGMSPDVRQRAFDPFFTTKGPAGSGLGLSQVYGMARQSGGAVKIDSTAGEGTRVTLLLPRAAQEIEQEPARPDQEPPAAMRRRVAGELVLVVDDDHAVRQVTVEMLRDLGYETLQATGGTEALTLLDSTRDAPQLILLDYAMPGMNGLQLAGQLRDRGMTVPIALVTGYAEFTDRDARANPLDGLLRKPFTIRELQGLLAKLRALKLHRAQPVPVPEDAGN